ncbi:MAG: hypothetical protein IK024_01315, partial [Treponema sp.]|nr:hypothetical protein [Treponema sp.]
FIAPFSSSFGSYSFWSISMNYGNGFFYLAEIGYFRLSQNGRFRLALTYNSCSYNGSSCYRLF